MARASEGNEQLLCSFCGKSQRQVKKLIAGPGVYICDECIDLCNEIIDEELTGPAQLDLDNLPKPLDIYSVLNDYVISQEESKRTLAVAVYNHYKRVRMGLEDAEVELQKSNILLLGPTGCGKTLLAQTLARILNVPFAIADATALTEAGYVGEDVENILLKLIQAADFDIKKAETGIIYIDEVDKIARKADNPSITRDVSGEGVQQALLKILEGTIASVPPQGGRKHPHQEFLSIDTTNILFICGGAFAGLDKIIEHRMGKNAVGFGADVRSRNSEESAEMLAKVMPEDLMSFGLIPEFVGRLPVISAVHQLRREDLVAILTEPKNALTRQYQRFFGYDSIELVFTEDALWEIADRALERETGARGLRSIIELALLDVMFELPSRTDVTKCVITKETIAKGLKPTLLTSGGAMSDELEELAEESASRPPSTSSGSSRAATLSAPAEIYSAMAVVAIVFLVGLVVRASARPSPSSSAASCRHGMVGRPAVPILLTPRAWRIGRPDGLGPVELRSSGRVLPPAPSRRSGRAEEADVVARSAVGSQVASSSPTIGQNLKPWPSSQPRRRCSASRDGSR